MRVEAVDAEKKKIGAKTAQGFLGDGADQRERILPQRASGEDDLDGRSGKFGGDVDRVGDDREVLEITQGPGDGGGGGAGVQDDDLTFLHFGRGVLGDPHFFLTVQLLFFSKRGVFERTLARGQGPAVSAVHETVGMQDFEILANRNLRGFEMATKFGDQDPALAVEQLDDGATTFFVEHWNCFGGVLCSGCRPAESFCGVFLFIAFRFACPLEKTGTGQRLFGRRVGQLRACAGQKSG